MNPNQNKLEKRSLYWWEDSTSVSGNVITDLCAVGVIPFNTADLPGQAQQCLKKTTND